MANNTSNIALRMPTMDDVDQILEWENDPENSSFTSFESKYEQEDIRALVASNDQIEKNQQVRLMISSALQKEPIGTIDLYDIDFNKGSAGVGILIDKAHRRNGYAVKALHELEVLAVKRLELKKLYSEVPTTNAPSLQLFEKAGFNKQALRKNQYEINSVPVDVYFYEKKIQ